MRWPRKIRKAKTDPAPLPGEEALTPTGNFDSAALAKRPEAFNLLSIYAALSGSRTADVLREFAGREFLPVQEGSDRPGGRCLGGSAAR